MAISVTFSLFHSYGHSNISACFQGSRPHHSKVSWNKIPQNWKQFSCTLDTKVKQGETCTMPNKFMECYFLRIYPAIRDFLCKVFVQFLCELFYADVALLVIIWICCICWFFLDFLEGSASMSGEQQSLKNQTSWWKLTFSQQITSSEQTQYQNNPLW